MDIHVSVAILFCVVTVHPQAQQGISRIQEYVQDMKQDRYMAVQILQQMAVHNIQPTAVIIHQMTTQMQNP